MFVPSSVNQFDLFVLSTFEFQSPRDNFDFRRFCGDCVYLLNGEILFVFDFSFFQKFSLQNFERFKADFQIGLQNQIKACKLSNRNGIADVVAISPLDKENFFIFNSKSFFCLINSQKKEIFWRFFG